MSLLAPKKGPGRMTRVSTQPNIGNEEAERLEFEAELNASADKVFHALENARSKMTPEKRERAIRNSEAILRKATDGVRPGRKRA
jgi:hypothetical protein